MFERFSSAARCVVVDARDQARSEAAAEMREEHLLMALSSAPTAGPLLQGLGVAGKTRAPLLDEIRDARRRGGLSSTDAKALAGIGIDVNSVVDRVEDKLGPGVLAHDRRPVRQRRGRPPFSPGSKSALQAGLRQAVARGDKQLRDEHLLLGLLSHRSVVSDVLADHGVTTATVLAALDASSS